MKKLDLEVDSIEKSDFNVLIDYLFFIFQTSFTFVFRFGFLCLKKGKKFFNKYITPPPHTKKKKRYKSYSME